MLAKIKNLSYYVAITLLALLSFNKRVRRTYRETWIDKYTDRLIQKIEKGE